MSRRAAVLVILILVSMAAVLPLVNSAARSWRPTVAAGSRSARRHSRAWWKRHRARLRRQRQAALKRRRDFEAKRNHNLGQPIEDDFGPVAEQPSGRPRVSGPANGGSFSDPRGGFNMTLPGGWSTRPIFVNGEYHFRVFTPDGRPAGEAALAQLSAGANNESFDIPARNQRKMIAGVPYGELRHNVINKMIDSGGWVINDFEREIGGRRTFIVLAQTAGSNDGRTPPQSWTFYFTEMEGRVYSFATNTPLEFSERVASESEKVLASFQSGRRAVAGEPTNR